MIIWRVWATAIWFGVMFAVCTVLIAAALVAVLLAVFYGLVSPIRTPASCLRSLAANIGAAIARVQALGSLAPRESPTRQAGPTQRAET